MNKIPDYLKSDSDAKTKQNDVGDVAMTPERHTIEVVSVSGKNPAAPAGKSGMPIRMNEYQKEILTIASNKQGLTMSAYVRQSFMERARKEGIF